MKKFIIILIALVAFTKVEAQHVFKGDQHFEGKATGQIATTDSSFIPLGQLNDSLSNKLIIPIDSADEGVDLSGLLIDDDNSSDTTTYSSKKIDSLISSGGDGSGDMLKSTYDPTSIEGDAFDYNNFYNTPTIPTVNDATLTIQGSGIATGSQIFSANSATNKTATINVPATLSSYTNNVGFQTSTNVAEQISDSLDKYISVATPTDTIDLAGGDSTNIYNNDGVQTDVTRIYDLNGNNLVFRQSATGDSIYFVSNGNLVVSGQIFAGGMVVVPGTTFQSNGSTSIKNDLIYGFKDTITVDYTIVDEDHIIITHQTSAITVTLPTSTTQGRMLTVKNEGTGDITLTSMVSGDPTTISEGGSFRLIWGSDNKWHKIN